MQATVSKSALFHFSCFITLICVHHSIRVDLYVHAIASTVIHRTALSKYFPFLFSLPSPTTITIYVRTHAHAMQQHAIASTVIRRTVLSKFFPFLFSLPSLTHMQCSSTQSRPPAVLHPVSFFFPSFFLLIYLPLTICVRTQLHAWSHHYLYPFIIHVQCHAHA